MKLAEYLDGMRSAGNAAEIEAAIQAPFDHPWTGAIWARICAVRIEAGNRICDAHPHGHLVPRFGPRHVLTVARQTYRVSRGGNSTGARYAWHYAGEWAMAIMREHGLGVRAAHRVWECWNHYPHRCLPIIEKALAGEIPDPRLDTLIEHRNRDGGGPVSCEVGQDNARAHRPHVGCDAGGTLFDWGAGHSEGFDFINWHCNRCASVFTEYLSPGRLYAIRNGKEQTGEAA